MRFRITKIACLLLFIGVSNIIKAQVPNVELLASRANIEKRISDKVLKGDTLIVHVFVPLCDNENQGIVPVSKLIGNGLDARNNLYWGALYGVKTILRKNPNWTLLETVKNPTKNILERVIFYRKYTTGQKVLVVADAWRGDKMKDCVEEYLQVIAGLKQERILLDGRGVEISGSSDLIVLNGHNGLMDYPEIKKVRNFGHRRNETAIIGCISYEYFKDYLKQAKAYPLLTTKGLMAPEGYVLSGLLDAWATQQDASIIKSTVAISYNKYQKCGMKGANWLFKTGW